MTTIDVSEPRVAVFSSLTGGLGHYCAHLSESLSKKCYLKFITYPQIDLAGTVVKEITDSLIKRYIKWPRFDIDETNPASMLEIADYLEEKKINVINIHVGTTVKRKINYFMTFLSYLKSNSKIKIVYTVHDVLPFDEDKKLVKLLKLFYALADSHIVGNEHEKTRLMKYFDIPESNIHIVPHGIYNLFDRGFYTQQTAKSYLGIPEDKQVILFFGFLRRYKGFPYLIEAVNELSKKRNDFLVYVASSLKFADKKESDEYLKRIEELDLTDKFLLNFNYLDTLDIEAVFKASNFTILPYIHTSQSGVMMMSFGFKKPVIITDEFFDKEWVSNNAGLVVKPRDAHSLAAKIEILLNDPIKASSFGQYGYDFSKKNYNWVTVSEKYIEVFKSVLPETP